MPARPKGARRNRLFHPRNNARYARAMRRRVLASPFVVTIAVLPACGSPPEPGTAPNPPGTSTVSTPPTATPTNPPAPNPTSDPIATPSPTTQPPTMNPPPTTKPADDVWTLTKDGTTCSTSIQQSCPPGDSCNPPPPAAYPCPTDAMTYPTTITRPANAKECTLAIHRAPTKMPSCPPGAHCNPPPMNMTRTVACPK
jgi:hypothetical protein